MLAHSERLLLEMEIFDNRYYREKLPAHANNCFCGEISVFVYFIDCSKGLLWNAKGLVGDARRSLVNAEVKLGNTFFWEREGLLENAKVFGKLKI